MKSRHVATRLNGHVDRKTDTTAAAEEESDEEESDAADECTGTLGRPVTAVLAGGSRDECPGAVLLSALGERGRSV